MKRAQIPAIKEPIGLSRSDGKRPDGASLIPWKRGKPLAWDVTVSDTYAASHIGDTAENAETATNKVGTSKIVKYNSLDNPSLHPDGDRDRRSLELRGIGMYRETRQDNHRGYTGTLGNAISIPTVVHRAAVRQQDSVQKHV